MNHAMLAADYLLSCYFGLLLFAVPWQVQHVEF